MKTAPLKPQTVDEYIRACPPKAAAILRKIRRLVRAVAPDAEERISYRMPAFFEHGVLVYYAAFNNHIGLFPPVADARLMARAAPFAGPKGNLRFPLSEPIPYALIEKIVVARRLANRRKAAASRTRAPL
jgi:uncharacterized protein YdhG (YjbR/CyaY superfamily)